MLSNLEQGLEVHVMDNATTIITITTLDKVYLFYLKEYSQEERYCSGALAFFLFLASSSFYTFLA